ncbi:hypothetical protein AQUCO_04500129v1 [Aquilegia coerulea]|uniref:F-box domain-containing protein n=1 Tax=Aquilegia coerulea TaxID=218851 RepID=A0A2G5CM19_AQUCA|nr:hypothetical protein AQUCO_04500129v1 [Aquilegia coerulea]
MEMEKQVSCRIEGEEEEKETTISFCDEIEEKILLNLPIKSLLRFKCVSKPWYTRITNSRFIHKHLRLSQSQANNNKLNLMLHDTYGPLSYYGNQFLDDDDAIATPTPLPLNQPLLLDFSDDEKKLHKFHIVGSCDGLLLVVVTWDNGFLVRRGADVIYIWNPTTREYKTLPKLVPTDRGSWDPMVYGFGRDPTIDNNYKVLHLGQSEVHLYTTQTNSWKTLLPDIPFYCSGDDASSMKLAYANLHFIAEIKGSGDFRKSVVSFDLKDDKFRALPHPPFKGDSHPHLKDLCALNGGLWAFSGSRDLTLYCLWMMKNFGEEERHWKKMFSFNKDVIMDNPPLYFSSAVDFLQDGRQVLLTAKYKRPHESKSNSCVICYHIDTKRARILIEPVPASWSMAAVYVESLISPNATSTDDDNRDISN